MQIYSFLNKPKVGDRLSAFSRIPLGTLKEFEPTMSQRVLRCAKALRLSCPGAMKLVAMVSARHSGGGKHNYGMGVGMIELDRPMKILQDPCFWVWLCVDDRLVHEVAQVYYREITRVKNPQTRAELAEIVYARAVHQVSIANQADSMKQQGLLRELTHVQQHIGVRSMLQTVMLERNRHEK